MIEADQAVDLKILAAIQSGDRIAFARLYERHAGWLLALSYRILQNKRDAEDLLHDVFIEIWNKAPSYDEKRGSVRSWLAVRTRSRALDRIRALNAIRKKQTDEFDSHSSILPSTEQTDSGVDHQAARLAVDRLSEKQRMVIELSYFQGLTCQEIADHCEIPLGTVKSRLSSALNSLRHSLKPIESNSPCN